VAINNPVEIAEGAYVADVINCSRCGKVHEHLRFARFRNPPPDVSHWATCPTWSEPILLQTARKIPAPLECKSPSVHPHWCGCPLEAA